MPAIVEYPQVVREAMDQFGDLFACEPQRRHFAEYLTGLMVAANKTVTGINAKFVETTDLSCLNRFLTEAVWNVQALNQRRLELLQRDATTRYSDQGVIALDDTLIDHDGKFIKDVGWFWDHAEERHKIAHDYLFVNYVCTSGKHYPLEFRRFKKRQQCEATGETFQDHTVLFCQLVDWVCEREIPGDFTFDSYFTHADNLNHIHSKQDQRGQPRAYVGDLKFNRKPHWKGTEQRADALAATSGNGASPRRSTSPRCITRSGSSSSGTTVATPRRARCWSATGRPGKCAASCGRIEIVGQARRPTTGTVRTGVSITGVVAGDGAVVPFWQQCVELNRHGLFEVAGDLAANFVGSADDVDRGSQTGRG